MRGYVSLCGRVRVTVIHKSTAKDSFYTIYVTQTVPAIAWLYSTQGSLSLATLSHMLPLFH